MSAPAASIGRPRSSAVDTINTWTRNHAWTLGLLGFLLVLLAFTKFVNANYSLGSLANTATSVVPLGLAAVAQAVVVISGGIDLSISSQMALTSCVAATLMANNPGDGTAVAIVIGVLLLGAVLGAVNGALVVLTKVPDIVVTLATYFVWAGFALLVRPAPGGSAAQWLKDLVVGSLGVDVVPKAAVVLVVIVAAIWIPLSSSRLGLSLYAVGSNRLAAFRSGVAVDRTKFFSYVITGFIAAFAGLSLTASTGIGTPVPEPTYVLISIGAVVLGGVSLAGGTGGVFGPLVAVVVLQLIRDDMTFMHVDSNYGLVAQGFILIGVLMGGSLIQMREEAHMTAATSTVGERGLLRPAAWRNLFRDYPLIPLTILLFLLIGVVELVQPGTVNPGWAAVNIRQAVILAILAGCQTLTMLTGGIDLSVAYVASMSGFVTATFVHQPGGWVLGVGVALAAAALAGLVSGIGIGIFRVHPLIMTLAMGLIVYGFANVWQLQNVQTGSGVPIEVRTVGTGLAGDLIPYNLVVFVPIAILLVLVLRRTGFGRMLYAVGDNPVAARLSGVRSWQVLVALYVISALLAAVAGLLQSGLSNTASVTLVVPYLLPSVAAAVIGGTSIIGGRGGYSGTIVGALILTVLTGFLSIILPEPWRLIVFGSIVVLVAAAYTRVTAEA